MNRKQRRAKGVKSHDPAFVIKQSEMSSFIGQMLQTEEVKKVIKEEAERVNLQEAQKMAEDIDVLILMTLHTEFDFGKVRLERFVKGLAKLKKYYEGRYEDSDIFAMKRYLEERVGVNIADIQKEVDKIVSEESPD